MNAADSIFLDAVVDDGFNYTLSPNNGEGSVSMKTLITQHVLGILKPVNENILDLQMQAQQIRDELAQAGLREAEHQKWLGRHDEELSAKRERLGSLDEDVVRLRSGLDEAGQQHLALEVRHDKTQTSVDMAIARMDMAAASMEALQSSFASSDARTSELQSRLDQTLDLARRVERSLGELKESHVGLQNRHLDVARGQQNTVLNCEDVQNRMQKFASISENQKAEVERAILALNDRTFDVEKCSMDLRDELQCVSEAQQKLDNHMNEVLRSVGMIEHNFQSLDAQKTKEDGDGNAHEEAQAQAIEEARTQAQTVAQRIVSIESSLAKLTQEHSSEMEKNTRNRGAIQELTKQVSTHSSALDENKSRLEGLKGMQQRADELLQSFGTRTKQLEGEQARLDERANTADAAMVALGAFREDAAVKIDLHSFELERGKMRQEQLQTDLGQASVSIEFLNTDVATANSQLGHVRDRVNLAHEYFDGLDKGLLDMHRDAVGGTGTFGSQKKTRLPQNGSLPGIPNRGTQALARTA